MARQSIEKIINDRGGSAEVARGLSTPKNLIRRSTVHTWVKKNSIPWWRIDVVMALPLNPKPKKRRPPSAEARAAA